MAKIAPSVLGADFSRLGEEIKSANEAGVEILHLDIMDGHFVPNISFGPAIVKTIDKLTGAYLDVHLMLSEPEKYFEDFVKAGADCITFHYQVHPEPKPYVEQLRKLGVKAGYSINPDIDIEKVLPHLEHFDLLLLMSVYPGFGGQKFIEAVLPKITAARRFIDQHGLNTVVAVDGGVDAGNAAKIAAAGADWLVMGTAFFSSDDRPGLVELVNKL
jgi:ribulose-phosphate 3-epimerase